MPLLRDGQSSEQACLLTAVRQVKLCISVDAAALVLEVQPAEAVAEEL